MNNFDIYDLIQGSDKWLSWRKTGVTATCTPTLNPGVKNEFSNTPYSLYLEWIGAIPPKDLSCIRQVEVGKLSEQFARHWFENQYGEISSPCCVRSRKYPHMIASLDGLIENNDVVEFKNISPKNHRLLLEEKAKSSIFNYYKWQVYHQMVVTGSTYGYLVFWSAKETPLVFKLKINDKIINKVVTITKRFWNCVNNKTPPEFDVNKDIIYLNSDDVLKERNINPEDLISRTKKLVELQSAFQLAQKQLNEAKEKVASFDEQIRNEIKVFSSVLKLQPNAPLRLEGFGIRYLESHSAPRFSWKKLREKLGINEEDHPDCYGESSIKTSITSYEYHSSNSISPSDNHYDNENRQKGDSIIDIYNYL